jgi:hypothetical protein
MPKQTTVPKPPEESLYELLEGLLALLKQVEADLPPKDEPNLRLVGSDDDG